MSALVTNDTADGVATAAKVFLHDQALAGEVHVLDVDRTGVHFI